MRLSSLLILLLAAAASGSAQQRPTEETDEPTGRTTADEPRPYDELVAAFQNDYFRVTALIKVVPSIPFEDAEGNQARFDVSAARLGVAGQLGGGVGYRLLGELVQSPTLLEAYVSYGSEQARAIVGRQMVPFSAEFLVGAANTDFVNRSRAIRSLVPGREIGAALAATVGGVTLRGGLFNATQRRLDANGAPVSQRERGGVLVVGRAQRKAPVGGGTLTLGANAGYDTPDTSDRVDASGRLSLGADARLRLGAILLAGEYLYSRTDDAVGGLSLDQEAHGGYATAGYDLSPNDRVLIRLDTFTDSQEGLIGYNRAFTPAASFQANLIVPFDDQAEPLQALLNFQLAF